MKKTTSLILALALMCFGAFAMTGCGDDYDDYDSDSTYDDYDSGYDDYDSGYDDYDSGYGDYSDDSGSSNFGDYDYDSNGQISDGEFQDAVNDYMDENGF